MDNQRNKHQIPLNRFLMSFVYAGRGIYYAFVGQRNIKVQSIIGIIAITAAILLKISRMELIIIVIISFVVVILEMFNSGFERLIDIINPEFHSEYGKIKDIIAGVVLMSSILAVIIGLLILGPPLVELIFGKK